MMKCFVDNVSRMVGEIITSLLIIVGLESEVRQSGDEFSVWTEVGEGNI